MKGSTEISPKQHKLIAFLLIERTAEEACNKSQVAVSTYWRWMKEERFLLEFRRARRGIIENTVAKLQRMTIEALETLEKNLHCENPAAEIRAAQIILEQGFRGVELLDIENRLEYLEENLKGQTAKK